MTLRWDRASIDIFEVKEFLQITHPAAFAVLGFVGPKVFTTAVTPFARHRMCLAKGVTAVVPPNIAVVPPNIVHHYRISLVSFTHFCQ